MQLLENYFNYAGTSSANYHLIIANVTTEEDTTMSGEISGVFLFNKRSKRNELMGTDYSSSPLSFDVDIVTEDGTNIPASDVKDIERWLFNRSSYKKLFAVNRCGTENISSEFVNCRFISPRKIVSENGIVGYTATCETDSGWVSVQSTPKIYNFDNLPYPRFAFNITSDSDWDEYIYPEITMRTGTYGGDVTIFNLTDSATRTLKFSGLPASTLITIKGEYNYVSGNYFSYLTERNFPRMRNGINNFNVNGNVVYIAIEWCDRRNF